MTPGKQAKLYVNGAVCDVEDVQIEMIEADMLAQATHKEVVAFCEDLVRGTASVAVPEVPELPKRIRLRTSHVKPLLGSAVNRVELRQMPNNKLRLLIEASRCGYTWARYGQDSRRLEWLEKMGLLVKLANPTQRNIHGQLVPAYGITAEGIEWLVPASGPVETVCPGDQEFADK